MSGDDDQQLQIILDDLARLRGLPPPPQITPDQLATGQSALSQLLKLLGIASNGGDPSDTLDALTGHAERGAKTDDALTKFPASEAESSAKLAGLGSQYPMAQMGQMIPQMASGIAGALGGLLQPLGQIPQQFAQVGQQALQAGMGALQHGAGGAATATVGGGAAWACGSLSCRYRCSRVWVQRVTSSAQTPRERFTATSR